MRIWTILIVAFLACPAPECKADVLVSRQAIELPRFEAVADRPLIHLYANEPGYERAREDEKYAFERLVYTSGGLEVVCLYYRRVNTSGAERTIVFNRGSYVRNDTAPEYLTMFHRLAESGFSIVAPMYRGSEGADGTDEMGGKDLDDLMRIVELAAELPSIDSQRLYLMGESRGGMMVLQAIREGFPALAAAVYGAPTDFHGLLRDHPGRYQGVADQLWPDWRRRPDAVLGRRSAITWADKLDIPLLIMHGGNDRSMPVSQSLSFASRLEELGKTYALRIFGYENHRIAGMAAERDALAVDWFERHAREPDAASIMTGYPASGEED